MTKDRLVSFTDAVIAIIMTILVLDLKKPHPLTLGGFWDLRYSFMAYTLSFFWLGTMWIILHNTWYEVKRIDTKTIWYTLIMLFFTSFFPYSTSLVAANFNNKLAQCFYGIVVLLVFITRNLQYRAVIDVNQDSENLLKIHKEIQSAVRIDLLNNLIGLVLTLTVYTPGMTLSVLISMIGLIVFRSPYTSKREKS